MPYKASVIESSELFIRLPGTGNETFRRLKRRNWWTIAL